MSKSQLQRAHERIARVREENLQRQAKQQAKARARQKKTKPVQTEHRLRITVPEDWGTPSFWHSGWTKCGWTPDA